MSLGFLDRDLGCSQREASVFLFCFFFLINVGQGTQVLAQIDLNGNPKRVYSLNRCLMLCLAGKQRETRLRTKTFIYELTLT